jgi:hypothetical protein
VQQENSAVFHAKVNLCERTEINDEIHLLRKKAERSRLPTSSVDSLLECFVAAVTPLIESGRLMKAQGSSLNATRFIKGPDYNVQLMFTTSSRQSYFEKLKSYIFSR